MTSDRIKEIQLGTAYPESHSVKQALMQVWNECDQQARQDERRKVLNEVIDVLMYKIRGCKSMDYDGIEIALDLCKSMLPKEEVEKKRIPIKGDVWAYKEHPLQKIIFDKVNGDFCFYSYVDGTNTISSCLSTEFDSIFKFVRAEIVSEPVIQDEEIKIGDEVEACNSTDNWHRCIWTGGITTEPAYICQSLGTAGGYVGDLRIFKEMRKVQPTKRPSLVEAERIYAETIFSTQAFDNVPRKELTELIEKLILKKKE